MDTLRLWLLFHFASGEAFFSGSGLLLAAIGLSPWIKSKWTRSLRMAAVILGAALVAGSAIPAAWLIYVVLTAITLAWLVVERKFRDQAAPALLRVRLAAVAAWMIALAMELPHQFSPTVSPAGAAPIEVIGDSITAGVGESGVTRWPQLLAQEHQLMVIDHALMGATAASASKQADDLGPGPSLVLVEIGGNDLLGSTVPVAFEQDLRKLLTKVCQPGRTVVMLELPLPPLYNRWGQIQRRVAGEFGAPLVPRRVLARVILSPGNTSDSLHLTQQGHTALAAAMWQVVKGALLDQPAVTPNP